MMIKSILVLDEIDDYDKRRRDPIKEDEIDSEDYIRRMRSDAIYGSNAIILCIFRSRVGLRAWWIRFHMCWILMLGSRSRLHFI